MTLSGVSNYLGTTTVSGGLLVLDGADRLSALSSLTLAGGSLELASVGRANGQTFASLALGASSAIDLDASSLTFNGLGTVVAGSRLSVVDYLASGSPDYAIRFLGDLAGNSSFQTLIAGMTIDGMAVRVRFDGVYTDITAVPEPGSWAMLLAGLVLFGARVRRRSPSKVSSAS